MKKVILSSLLVLLCLSAHALDEVNVKSNYKGSNLNEMCEQSVNILNRIKSIDSSVNFDLNCYEKEVSVEKSIFGISNTIVSYEVIGEFSGNPARSCVSSEKYKILTTPVKSRGYSTKSGLPAGINPYLTQMLDKMDVMYKYAINSFDYNHSVTVDFIIMYPVCD